MGLETLAMGALGLGSSLIGSNAAGKAADTQVAGTDRAIASQEQMFNTVNQQGAPYRAASQTGLTTLLQGLAPGGALDTTKFNYSEDPGFQFAMNKGMTALNAGAAARTGALSGGNQKALAGYATGAANQGYNDAFNRFQTERTNRIGSLTTLAGLGPTVNNTTANLGASTAAGVGQAAMAGGQAAASGIVGSANAVTGGMSNMANMYMQNKFMNSILG